MIEGRRVEGRVEGLSHITLITRDLARMTSIVEGALGTYNHIAFKIPASAMDDYRARIEALGLEIRESRPRVEGEGHSLYFYDDDNHLFELHTGTLEERLERYRQGRSREDSR